MLEFPWVLEIASYDGESDINADVSQTILKIKFKYKGEISTYVSEFVDLSSGIVEIIDLKLAPNMSYIDLPFFVKKTSPIPYIEQFTTADFIFSGCEELKRIPKNLFKFNPQIKSFVQTFNECYSLTSIPKELFKYNIEVKTFSGCFRGCGIKSIPEGLFFHNTKALHFLNCFACCDNLKKLDKPIFPSNYNLTKDLVKTIFNNEDLKLDRKSVV